MAYIRQLNVIRSTVEKKTAATKEIKKRNDNIIKCKKDYLKEELQKAKDCKLDANNLKEENGKIDVIENIERRVAIMSNHTFKVERTRYNTTLVLGEKPKIPQGPTDLLTTTEFNCHIMEGCMEKVEINTRKRKQLKEDVAIPNKKQRKTVIPDLVSQKGLISYLVSKELLEGDTWHLIDSGWFNTWAKYVGFESRTSGYDFGFEHRNAGYNGDPSSDPGPIDNSSLLDESTGRLKENTHFGSDFTSVPEEAWVKFVEWYGCKDSSAIPRKVITEGQFFKTIETHLVSLMLFHHPNIDQNVTKEFSRADKVYHIEKEIRNLFQIPDDRQVLLWKKYGGQYRFGNRPDELLYDLSLPILDAGINPGDAIYTDYGL